MSSSPSPSTIKAVQVASLFTIAASSGAKLGLSIFAVPRLLESPGPLMLQQWDRMFVSGRAILPAADVLSALGFSYLAYSRVFGERTAKMYALAAALSVGIVPYTFLVMSRTNNKLRRRAELTKSMSITDESLESAEVRQGDKFLVDHWGVLNLGRTAMLAAAGLVGLYASL
ncbi:hypothetical protein MCOR27_009062 [Pyricularia oryzae]|uniref:DUF1772-domain-containing protein n=1 Tax=Pyricularia grisea TaxID=148305 RepID=A0ABQ8ND35_PYRGI|nr:hypothetical protein MCOR01_007440 [Pyricularia oryzae]KAI6295128.1 hypothetical protein MCOR33_007903 [Pyricularia grisea]KAI6260245.1 hypothetical protein MCOR19_003476 [Pyricularia oryzae]KAI6270936.1 hypothetical protein MCOR27_009062 [Pyricularia oryzae]KAI6279514.1 hypothetical protein MCOR26_004143 [Pyricularia oryzae]